MVISKMLKNPSTKRNAPQLCRAFWKTKGTNKSTLVQRFLNSDLHSSIFSIGQPIHESREKVGCCHEKPCLAVRQVEFIQRYVFVAIFFCAYGQCAERFTFGGFFEIYCCVHSEISPSSRYFLRSWSAVSSRKRKIQFPSSEKSLLISNPSCA